MHMCARDRPLASYQLNSHIIQSLDLFPSPAECIYNKLRNRDFVIGDSSSDSDLRLCL
jgi:hypothetical protein